MNEHICFDTRLPSGLVIRKHLRGQRPRPPEPQYRTHIPVRHSFSGVRGGMMLGFAIAIPLTLLIRTVRIVWIFW